MGRIPGFTDNIFPPAGMPVLTMAANFGLVLFLFLVGLEVDLRLFLRDWRIALSVGFLLRRVSERIMVNVSLRVGWFRWNGSALRIGLASPTLFPWQKSNSLQVLPWLLVSSINLAATPA